MQDIRIVERIKSLVLEYLESEGVSIRDSEERVRELVHEAGAKSLGERWSRQAEQEEPERWECECGRKSKGRQRLSKTVVTLLGSTEINRMYYWCRKCNDQSFWLDEQLGSSGRSLTGKVQECIALTVAEMPYLGAQRILETLSGLSFAHSTLEDVAESLGGALCAQRDEETRAPEQVCSDEESVGNMCRSTDGVKVPLREDKGWEEARVVAVFPYEVTPGGCDAEPCSMSDSARIENCEPTGERMFSIVVRFKSQARARGLDRAKRVVVVGDGAPWIWNQTRLHFPGAIEIMDWYHAMEHLWQVVNTLF